MGRPVVNPFGGLEGTSAMLEVVKKLMKYRDAEIFLEPVDWRGMDLTDYPKVVETPMDLGTVKSQVEMGMYDSSERLFWEHIELIWNNCELYNGHISQYGRTAQKMRDTTRKQRDLYNNRNRASQANIPSNSSVGANNNNNNTINRSNSEMAGLENAPKDLNDSNTSSTNPARRGRGRPSTAQQQQMMMNSSNNFNASNSVMGSNPPAASDASLHQQPPTTSNDVHHNANNSLDMNSNAVDPGAGFSDYDPNSVNNVNNNNLNNSGMYDASAEVGNEAYIGSNNNNMDAIQYNNNNVDASNDGMHFNNNAQAYNNGAMQNTNNNNNNNMSNMTTALPNQMSQEQYNNGAADGAYNNGNNNNNNTIESNTSSSLRSSLAASVTSRILHLNEIAVTLVMKYLCYIQSARSNTPLNSSSPVIRHNTLEERANFPQQLVSDPRESVRLNIGELSVHELKGLYLLVEYLIDGGMKRGGQMQ